VSESIGSPRNPGRRARVGFFGAVVLASGLVGPSPAMAQAAGRPALEVGSRVRVTSSAEGLKRAVGGVAHLTRDSVTVRFPGGSVHDVALNGDATLEISVRRRHPVLESTGVGLLAGAGIGALIGLASGDDTCPSGSWCILQFSAGEKAEMGAVAFGVLGGVAGLAMGWIVSKDVWEKVVPARRGGPTIAPTFDGQGTGFRLSVPVGPS
jgi:hypothetical protein